MYCPAFPLKSLPNLGNMESGIKLVVAKTSNEVSKVVILSTAGISSDPISVPFIFVQLEKNAIPINKIIPFNSLQWLTYNFFCVLAIQLLACKVVIQL